MYILFLTGEHSLLPPQRKRDSWALSRILGSNIDPQPLLTGQSLEGCVPVNIVLCAMFGIHAIGCKCPGINNAQRDGLIY